MRVAVLFMGLLLMAAGCRGKKGSAQADVPETPRTETVEPQAPSPPGMVAHVLVYRTRTDLRDRVPVGLDAERKSIVSYPHPTDLRLASGLPLPTELGDGWLMDNRGIGANTAFLKMTYTEYAAMDEVPPLAELEAAIVDRDPLTDLCDCGPRTAFANPAAELARIIRNDSLLLRCKRIK